jgi:hypothetical protein
MDNLFIAHQLVPFILCSCHLPIGYFLAIITFMLQLPFSDQFLTTILKNESYKKTLNELKNILFYIK